MPHKETGNHKQSKSRKTTPGRPTTPDLLEYHKKTIQETQPATPQMIQINSSTHIKLTALILEAHIASLAGKEKYADILSKSLKLNFNIDAKFSDRSSAAIFNMRINRENIKPKRPNRQQQFDLSQDYMDDVQMDTQLPTNLSLSEAEPQQDTQRTSSPKNKSQIKDQAFKISKNPKKRTLQASPTTSTSTFNNKRRTNSESSTTSSDMNMEMPQKETTIDTALHVTDKIQLKTFHSH